MFSKILSISSLLALACAAFAEHPIITTNYTADPAPYVHGDTVYLYTTHDEWLIRRVRHVRLAVTHVYRHGQLD